MKGSRVLRAWFPLSAAAAAMTGGLGCILLRLFPLPPSRAVGFISGYGTVDNRELLLRYLLLVVAVIAAPGVVALLSGARLRGPTPEEAPAGRPLDRRWLPGTLVVLGSLVVGSLLFLGPWIAYGPLDGHELVHLGYLSEIGHGKVLGVDTGVTYGPLLGYSIDLFLKLTSYTLVGFRAYWNVTTVLFLAVLAGFAFQRFRHRTLFAVFLLYVLLFTTAHYYLPEHEGIRWGWANLWRHGWTPLAILALSRPLLATRRAWPRVMAGFLPVLGGFYGQETGPLGLAALGSLVVLAGWGRMRRLVLRDLPWMALGAGLGVIVAAIPAIRHGALLEYLAGGWGIPGLFLQGAGNLRFPGLPEQGFPGSLLYYMVPGVVLLLLLHAWVRFLRGDRERSELIALGIYAALSYVTVLVRADTHHLLNIMPAVLLLGFLSLDSWLSTGEREPAPGRRALPWVVSAVLFACSLAFSPGPGFLARSLVNRIQDPWPGPTKGWERMAMERGGLWTPPHQWLRAPAQPDHAGAVAMIRDLNPAGSTLLDGRRASLYYFLTGVPCAVPFTDVPSQCLTPGNRKALLDALVANRPRFVFTEQVLEMQGAAPPSGYARVGAYGGWVCFLRGDLFRGAPASLLEDPDVVEKSWSTRLLAMIRTAQGDGRGAATMLRGILDHEGESADLRYFLARAEEAAGDTSLALNAYRASLGLDPTQFSAYEGLESLCRAQGDLGAAESVRIQAEQIFPGAPRVTRPPR